ncbi:hypothetical protein TMatcc_004715 [Talaromyces marneffei ATCC 18224]
MTKHAICLQERLHSISGRWKGLIKRLSLGHGGKILWMCRILWQTPNVSSTARPRGMQHLA